MDKTNGVEKMAHAQADAEVEVQMQSPPIKNRKKIWRRLRPLVKHQLGIEKYTPELVDFFVNLLCESSALCIQAAWKGYVARKQYPTLREQLRREKAAVTIQRFVREWLYKKKIDELFKKKKDSKEETFEFTLEEMDEKIMDWRKKHNIYSVAIPEDNDELDREIERQMKQFYKSVEISKERTQYVDKLLCEIDYQLSTLTDITSLFEKDESEAAKYNEGRREAYTRALSSVQQNLRYMNAPWFRRIDYELSGDYNDVYFPSEIDACVQFSKEQEEARKPDYNDVYFPSEIDACVQFSKEQEEARKPDYNDVYFPSEIDACVQFSKEQEEARKPDYNDVYFPSEIDACVQFSKEQEEARKPDYNDVYFPSEIDACVQFSKEQEEARKPDYNDVYFPSEIDACVQFSKEQEEARKPDSEEEIKL